MQAYRIGNLDARAGRRRGRRRGRGRRAAARRRSSPRLPRCPRWNDSRIEPASTSTGCARVPFRGSAAGRSTSSRRGRCLARRWTRRSWRGDPTQGKSERRRAEEERRKRNRIVSRPGRLESVGPSVAGAPSTSGFALRRARWRCLGAGAFAGERELVPHPRGSSEPQIGRRARLCRGSFAHHARPENTLFAGLASRGVKLPADAHRCNVRFQKHVNTGARAGLIDETVARFAERGVRGKVRAETGDDRREPAGESANRWDAEGVWCESVDAELKETVREMLKARILPAYKGRRSRRAVRLRERLGGSRSLGSPARAFGVGLGRAGTRFPRRTSCAIRIRTRTRTVRIPMIPIRTRKRSVRAPRSARDAATRLSPLAFAAISRTNPGVARRVRQRARAGQDARHAPRGPPRRRRRETRASRDDGGCR